MSIFDNIVFDEFTLLEGEQAEAYKKRKAEEKKKAEDEYNSKALSRNEKLSNAVKNNKLGVKNISNDEWDKLVDKSMSSFSDEQLEKLGRRRLQRDKTVQADAANALNSTLRHNIKEFKKNKREGH